MVCCAFSFCWYHQQHGTADEALADCTGMEQQVPSPVSAVEAGREKTEHRPSLPATRLVAGRPPSGTEMAGVLDHAAAVLEDLVQAAPPPVLQQLLDWLWQGRGIALYDSS